VPATSLTEPEAEPEKYIGGFCVFELDDTVADQLPAFQLFTSA
jgi:hypothetical protein